MLQQNAPVPSPSRYRQNECLSCSNQRWFAGKSNMDDFPSSKAPFRLRISQPHLKTGPQLLAQARYACHFSELGEAWAIRDLRQALGSSAPWLVDFPNETSKQLGNFPVATFGIPGTSYRRLGESLLFFKAKHDKSIRSSIVYVWQHASLVGQLFLTTDHKHVSSFAGIAKTTIA